MCRENLCSAKFTHLKVKYMLRDRMFALKQRISNRVIVGFKSADAVALTFDDGPDPQFTPMVIDILKKHGVRATFFVLGRQAELYPHILREIINSGSEIANHSYSHPSFSLLSVVERLSELKNCQRSIGKSGKQIFRPPYGHASGGTPFWASVLDFTTVNWSADAKDWEDNDHISIHRMLTENVKPGSVVLLHDRLENATDTRLFNRQGMVTALDKFLEERVSEMTFRPISEMISLYEPICQNWDDHLDIKQLRQRKTEFSTLALNSP
jgi:peptidoglycan/xylan/chitin deacetylase (PgdA/CDA1 family)